MTNTSFNFPMIFKGLKAKLLTSRGIEFKDGTSVETGTTDPSSVAVNATKGSIYSDTTNGRMLIKQDAGNTTNWSKLATLTEVFPAQEIIVAKSGGQYDTIQSAINSINDASVAKPYVVKIYPGIYNEQITMKDYVSLAGVASIGSVIITHNSTVISGSLTDSTVSTILSHLTIVNTPIADNQHAVDISGSYGMTDCFIQVQTSSDVSCSAFNINTNGTVAITSTTPQINNTYAGGTKTIRGFSIAGSGLVSVTLSGLFIQTDSLSSNCCCYYITGTNKLQFGYSPILYTNTNASYNGTVNAYCVHNASTQTRIIEYGDVRLIGNGSGTAVMAYIDSSGANAEIFYSSMTLQISGFTTGQEYVANTALGDTQKIWLNSTNKNLPKTGAGLAMVTPYELVQTGFVEWSSIAGNYWSYDSNTKIFTVLKRGTGMVMSSPVVWAANQTVTLTDLAVNYIYVTSSGTLTVTTSAPASIYQNNIVLFEVWVQDGNYIVCKENHPAKFTSAVSTAWHNLFGPLLQDVTQTLAIGNSANRQVNIVGTNTLTDHGLDTNISAQTPATWIQVVTGVSGHMTQIANSSSIQSYKSDGSTSVNATAMVANTWYQIVSIGTTDFTLHGAASNTVGLVFKATGAGTGTGTTTRVATIVANNRFSVYRLGVVKDSLNTSDPVFICSADNTDYSSVANATNAITAGSVIAFPAEAKALEIVQLGYAIVHANGTTTGTLDANSVITSLQVFGAQFVGGGTSASASLITTTTTNFTGELSTTETNVQSSLERLDAYDSMLDWATGKVYRVGNIIRSTLEGFIGNWRCISAHTASAAFTTDIQAGRWEILSNSEGSRELVNQAGHGFVAGDVVYYTGVAYAKSKADAVTTSRIDGFISGATTDYFVLAKTGKITKTGWALTAGSKYFLSATTAGAITTTDPGGANGYISKPVLLSVTTTTGNIIKQRENIMPTVYGTGVTGGSLKLRGNAADLTTGQVDVESSKDATNTTTAALAVAGGLGVSKKSYFGDLATFTKGISATGGTTNNYFQLETGGTAGTGKITLNGTTWQFGDSTGVKASIKEDGEGYLASFLDTSTLKNTADSALYIQSASNQVVQIRTGVSGGTYSPSFCVNGRVSFGNGATSLTVPSIMGLTTSNASGLQFISYTPDANTNGDMGFFSASDNSGAYGDHATTTRDAFFWQHYTTVLGRVTRAGLWYNVSDSTAWNTTSDRRVKTNIREIGNALDKVLALHPVHFEYIHKPGKTKTSFIAQEFEQILPGHVTESTCPKEIYSVAPELKDELIKGLDCDLFPYLVKAIQEQQIIIEELKSRIETLENM